MRLLLTFPLLAFPQMAFAQSCGVDMSAVEKRIGKLELSYEDVLSDISCDAPTIPAHVIMCEDESDPSPELWRMGRLNDLASIYAYENATGTETDHANPPRSGTFITERDACTDEVCLCVVLVEHTNESLGGTSPYHEE